MTTPVGLVAHQLIINYHSSQYNHADHATFCHSAPTAMFTLNKHARVTVGHLRVHVCVRVCVFVYVTLAGFEETVRVKFIEIWPIL